ncbi:lysylphosphatidylglycerol synthase domain-containing protein [Rhizobium oryzicola]|uniref:Lysylphosphatidylglycerol synthase domain-containing protein n=1 Tax=Rhizobium oryzicola TaxID=1232668 RepID=A0ABT8T0F8_9HYPH|nr:lysylphosphatidylglycerol synthase domain-containing protein [Rhizobium oryzicola]MDO1584229.1 lysylphosphatidylglycerol synthase domain-containing protein [Rhizobium oryzicola]
MTRHLFRIIIALLIAVAAVLVYRSLSRYSWGDITASMAMLPVLRIVTGALFVIASYLCLAMFDWLALRYVGHPQPFRRALVASFSALSIGHNVGGAALSSGAVRYRFYARWGLTGDEVAKVILFCGATVLLGLSTLAGIVLLLMPPTGQNLLDLTEAQRFWLGLAFLVYPVAYLICSVWGRPPLKFRSFRMEMPTPLMCVAQVAIGTLNFAFVAAALNQLLLTFTQAGYLQVASAYVTATVAGMLSHVPGGLGVLEATMLMLLPESDSIGALVAFRVLYYFVPLCLGLPIFLISEAYFRHQQREGGSEPAPRQA